MPHIGFLSSAAMSHIFQMLNEVDDPVDCIVYLIISRFSVVSVEIFARRNFRNLTFFEIFNTLDSMYGKIRFLI